MYIRFPKLLLISLMLFLLVGCNPLNPGSLPPSTPVSESDQDISIQAIAIKNPYLNNAIASKLRIQWEEYDASFTRQPAKQLTAEKIMVTEIKLTDGQWIFSPNNQIAVAINATTGEPDNSLDIYNRLNDKTVERLDFCGTPCVYLGTYWVDTSHFVLVATVENYLTNSSQPNGNILQVSYYDLTKGSVITYKSSKFVD
jgi:hypothetical protein